jgi:hypothetical protein
MGKEQGMMREVARVLVIAAVVLPLASCGGARTHPLLPGTWEVGEKSKRCSVEFTRDGKVHLSGDTTLLRDFHFAKPFAEYGLQPGRNLPITYRPVGEQELEIQGDYTALLEKLSGGADQVSPEKVKEAQREFRPQERVTYAVTEKELTLTSGQGKAIHLKRLD